jgi:hypothetical protein
VIDGFYIFRKGFKMSPRTAVAPRPAPITTPLNIEKCREGARKDFRDALRHSNDKGYYRLVITPSRFALRTSDSSSVRADFGKQGCNNSLILRHLYRDIAKEEEFKGITIWFDYDTKRSVDNGDHVEDEVNMLAVVFKVPVRQIKKRNIFSR